MNTPTPVAPPTPAPLTPPLTDESIKGMDDMAFAPTINQPE